MNPDTEYFKEAIINKLKNIDIPEWVKCVAVDRNGEVGVIMSNHLYWI